MSTAVVAATALLVVLTGLGAGQETTPSSSSSSDNNRQDLWNVFERCQSVLGKPSWVCDPLGKISDGETSRRISDNLWRLQTEVPCFCRNTSECFRYGDVQIPSGIAAALIVTSTLPPDVAQVSERIYKAAGLAEGNCDNGLLIVYGVDGRDVYALRGSVAQQSLFEDDWNALLTRTKDALRTDDYETAVPDLLQRYTLQAQAYTYERHRNWEPMVGTVVGCTLVALAAAVILGVFLTRVCCRKRSLSATHVDRTAYAKKQERMRKDALRRVRRRQTKAVVDHKRRMTSGRKSPSPPTPKRLVEAQRRQQKRQRRQLRKFRDQQKRGLLTPSSGSDEAYYVISEPSTIYQQPQLPPGTIRPPSGGHIGDPDQGQQGQLTISPPVLYSSSQASFPQQPSPAREVQRRDYFVEDVEKQRV